MTRLPSPSRALLLGLWLMLGTVAVATAESPDGSPRVAAKSDLLDKLFESTFEARLDLDPSFATSIGDRRSFGRLTIDLDPTFRKRSQLLSKKALRELEAIAPSTLDARQRLLAEAFKRHHQSRLELLELPQDQLPLRPGWGFTTRFAQAASGSGDLSFRNIGDHEAFLSRVDDLERWTQLAIKGLKRGMKEGIVHSRATVELMILELEDQLTPEAVDATFAVPLQTLPEDLDEEDRQVWSRHLSDAIEDGVVPAYAELYRFLVDVYLPQSRESISLSELPGGLEHYEVLARAYTTTQMTPREMFELGDKEARRIRRQIDVLERRLPRNAPGPITRWKTVVDRLRKTENTVRKQLPNLFHDIPDAPLALQEVEPFRSTAGGTAFYERASAHNHRPGTFYINLSRGGLDAGSVEALFLHEALPGHHFQISDTLGRESLPRFLRFGHTGAFVEGWALYSESLGRDLGLYRSPFQLLGKLYFELGRAGRLVADVGIHAFGWSRKKAERELGFRNLQWAIDEIDRYVNHPGQALSYKIGELKIQELRRRAEDALGDSFDIRDFHQKVLETGPLPLSVLEQKIDLWIEGAETPTP